MKLALTLSALVVLIACAPRGQGKDPEPAPGLSAAAASETSRPLAQRLADAESQLATFCKFNEVTTACATGPDIPYRLRIRREWVANYRQLSAEAGDLQPGVRARANKISDQLDAVGARLDREIVHAQARAPKQAALVKQINEEFGCGIVMFEEGQRMTYGRETGLANGCSPLEPTDYKRAAKLLRELADVSLGSEAVGFREKAQRFESIGPEVAYLVNLRRQLLELNVIQFDRDVLHVNHIGHPYGTLDETSWLRSYVFAVRDLANRWAAPDIVVDTCPQPVCDPRIYKAAVAVTLKPEIDSGFLRNGNRVVAPSTHALIGFSTMILANGSLRASLGLEPAQYSAQALESRLIEDDSVLLFPNVFANEHITLSIGKYAERTAYPYAYKYFAMFQEARYVVNAIAYLQQRRNEVAVAVKDLRFEKADGSGRLLTLTPIPGGYRLNLNVLNQEPSMSIPATRQAILAALPTFFESARQIR